MSDYSKISSESMKRLTEKVIKADLASRKRIMMNIKAASIISLFWVPVGVYVLNVIKYINN